MSLRSEVIRIFNELLGNSKKISELPVASALTGSEQMELNQSGSSVRTTAQDIANLGGGGPGTTPTLQEVITEGSELTGSNDITFSSGSINFVGVNPLNYLSTNGDGTIIRIGDAQLIFDSPDNSVKFNDARATPLGIQYEDDYSAFLSNRSLVDKQYVDNTINSSISARITYSDLNLTGM